MKDPVHPKDAEHRRRADLEYARYAACQQFVARYHGFSRWQLFLAFLAPRRFAIEWLSLVERLSQR